MPVTNDNRNMQEREEFLEMRIEALTRALREAQRDLESAKLLIAQFQRMVARQPVTVARLSERK